MDLKKIFIKDACPTKMGGQAVMEGIMMKGEKKTALAVRVPNGNIEIETKKTKTYGRWMKVPLVRGVVAFVDSLVYGCKTLMDSANILEEYDDEEYEQTRLEKWVEKKFGTEALWNFLIYSSLLIAFAFSIGIFIILPTWIANLTKFVTDSVIWINFIEGIIRIALFILYIWLVSKMPDIKRVFMFHGAEHKTIHAFENLPRSSGEQPGCTGQPSCTEQLNGAEQPSCTGQPSCTEQLCGGGQPNLEALTIDECRKYPTLHPRCGTSFLMFVFIIALACHILLGWPNFWFRLITRILLLPVVAGLSYELLKWAGRSDNCIVKILSMPGLWLQKITTSEPDDKMLEVAIEAIRAVCDDEPPGKYTIRAADGWPEDRFEYPHPWDIVG